MTQRPDNKVFYADDQIVTTKDVMEQYNKWGLEVNMNRWTGRRGTDIELEHGRMKFISQYNYLGTMISQDGKYENESDKNFASNSME